MIKRNGQRIAAIAMAVAIMGQSIQPIFAMEKEEIPSKSEIVETMEKSEDVAESKTVEDKSSTTIDFKVIAISDLHANLMNYDGDVDINEEDLKTLEIVVMGYHKGIKNGIKGFLGFSMGNIIADFLKICTKRRIEKNTQSYIMALERYPIDIISHLNLTAKVDVKKVAEACVKTNTYIEINCKRIHFTKAEVEAMLETDVKFVIDSDAHSPQRVGDDELGLEVAKMYGIPFDRIVNLNGLINIKQKNCKILPKS